MTRQWIDKWNSIKNNTQQLKQLFKPLQKSKLKAMRIEIETIHQDTFKKFDCLQCANCCKSIPPIVSARDSKRIAHHMGISRVEFSNTYLTVDSDGDTVINASPCPFLESDNRCRIYEVRPSACRQYPHSGELQFAKHLGLHQQNVRYCPALYKIIKDIADLMAK